MASFGIKFKKALKDAGLTQTQLSEITGISKAMISSYSYGTIPTPEKRKILESVLDLKPIEEPNSKEISVSEVPKDMNPLQKASEKLGISVESLKIGLINDLFRPQIGIAIPHDKSYTYQIFEKRLDKYLNGDDF